MVEVLPRLVVAGTRSGVGKTSTAVGLMAALRARGLRVAGHKVGPDFIDPGYHALASGRPPRNLDAFLVGAGLVAPLLAHGARGADLAIVEGVMGLFDGRGSGDEASTAHVSRLLSAPVLLVVDASAVSRSIAAEVHGFATFDPRVRIGGVVLNRVGSEGHERLLREALAPLDIPVVGALRRDDRLATPSRHLGLVPIAERQPAARVTVAALGAAISERVDLDSVLALARSAPPLDVEPWSPQRVLRETGSADMGLPRPQRTSLGPLTVAEPGPARPVVAVAGGPAFTFVYTEHRELLTAAGAELVTLDPTADEALPDGTAALYLGGGFPEEHAAELAANAPLRAAIAAFPGPIVAECGGMLYLCRSLAGQSMCGVVDADATWGERLALAYRTATSASSSPLGPAGLRVGAHEFHRTTVMPRAGQRPAWRLEDGSFEGFADRRLHASYLHSHWAAVPRLAAALVTAAALRPVSELVT
ncbi:MAG: cobyrinate a,c-diamide synthase [Actinomycetota bacterium]|nr:cobyrinate a,c-diamide synthase [Actinomycetota bacterium]